jgi:hypothetical protein
VGAFPSGLPEVSNVRVFTNGRVTPSRTQCGREATINNYAAGAKDTTPPYERWFLMDSLRISLLERWGCLRREQIFSLARQAWLSLECHRGQGENAVNSMWIFSGGRKKMWKKQLDSLTQKSDLSRKRRCCF